MLNIFIVLALVFSISSCAGKTNPSQQRSVASSQPSAAPSQPSISATAGTTITVTLSSDSDPGGIGDVGDLRYALNTMNCWLGHDFSIKFEYLYFRLDAQRFSGTTNLGNPYQWSAETSGHILRGGFNYHF